MNKLYVLSANPNKSLAFGKPLFFNSKVLDDIDRLMRELQGFCEPIVFGDDLAFCPVKYDKGKEVEKEPGGE